MNHAAHIAQSIEIFDRDLVVGAHVEVRWTNSHRYFAARAEVSQINTRSVRCKLLEAVTGVDGTTVGYPIGHRILVPRIYANRWSANNGVFPLAKLQGIRIDASGARVVRVERSDAGVREALGGPIAIGVHEFCPGGLLLGAQFVMLHHADAKQKQLPTFDPAIPLPGPLFVVLRPLVAGGFWQSMSSTDVAAFQRLLGIQVDGGAL